MKIKGTTLIESLVALLIIVMVISISLNVMVSNTQSLSKELTIKSQLQADAMISEVEQSKEFSSLETTIDGISYSRRVSFVNRYESIIKIEVTATLAGKQIYEKQTFAYLN